MWELVVRVGGYLGLVALLVGLYFWDRSEEISCEKHGGHWEVISWIVTQPSGSFSGSAVPVYDCTGGDRE